MESKLPSRQNTAKVFWTLRYNIEIYCDRVVCGATVVDTLTGEEWDVNAKCVINATGPFTDSIRQLDNPSAQKIVVPSAGVHVVLPGYYRYIHYIC